MRDPVAALCERAAKSPDSVFCRVLVSGSALTVSCGVALAHSQRYANMFLHMGLQPGDVVVIILRHSEELYFAFLGAMLARCVPSFMPFPSAKQDPEQYWTQHQAVFARIGVAAVVAYPELRPLIERHCPGLATMTPAETEGVSQDFDAPARGPDEIAFLQHSSGTTGLKKGVLLSYRAVCEQVGRYAEEMQFGAEDVIVSWLPLYHDMGLIACFMLPLMTGVPFVSLDAFEWVARPQLLFEAIRDYRGTHVWLPNFAFHHLCRTVNASKPIDLSSIKVFIDCSEPCRLETLEMFAGDFKEFGVRLDQCRVCYAMAETVFAVTQTPQGDVVRSFAANPDELARGRAVSAAGATARRIASVGRPLPDVRLKLIAADGSEAAPGYVGEVAIRAPFLFSGYHKDPERTAAKLRDGWYHTGDLGFVADGELYLLGRTDDLLILNGRNVLAHEVEFAINASVEQIKPGRCIALGVFNAEVGSQELVILAEPLDGGPDAGRMLRRQIKGVVLNAYGLIPREVQIVPPGWLVKSTSGKIARGLTLDKYLLQQLELVDAE